MDNLTKEQRHKNMSHIRCRDTKPELLLRRALLGERGAVSKKMILLSLPQIYILLCC